MEVAGVIVDVFLDGKLFGALTYPGILSADPQYYLDKAREDYFLPNTDIPWEKLKFQIRRQTGPATWEYPELR